jgi:hypothetical protein
LNIPVFVHYFETCKPEGTETKVEKFGMDGLSMKVLHNITTITCTCRILKKPGAHGILHHFAAAAKK